MLACRREASHDTDVIRPRDLSWGVKVFPCKTETLPPATHTNCYALGGSRVVVVDPGPTRQTEQQELVAWLAGMNADHRRVEAVLLTHHHPDHVGAADFLASALNVPIWAHEATASLLPRFPISRMLADGDVIELAGRVNHGWRVLHTPGHAPGHICLFEPALRVLVLGDMVASQGTILIRPQDGDMTEYLHSLERLARLASTLGLPAHGQPIESPVDVLRATYEHRLARERAVLDAVRQGDCGRGVSVDDLLRSTRIRPCPCGR